MDFTNKVFQEDNLELLKKIPPECVDLIYIDPPFMTQTEWKSEAGAFNDKFDGIDDFLAFISPRLIECRRVLKSTGSLMVHLDWHTVHYVKASLDKIFGYERFVNEIIWKRSAFLTSKHDQFARNHDTILWYSKTAKKTFTNSRRPLRHSRRSNDNDGRGDYLDLVLLDKSKENIQKLLKQNLLYKTKNGTFKKKSFLSKHKGVTLDTLWADIPKHPSQKDIRLSGKYPTQKPEKLLERIIRSCSKKGDLVADFFCGSGTTLAVAKKNGRNYLGCDVSADAVELTEKRLNGIILT